MFIRFLVSKSQLCCRNRQHIRLCLQNALRIKKTKKKTSHYVSKNCRGQKTSMILQLFEWTFRRKMKGTKNKNNHPKPAQNGFRRQSRKKVQCWSFYTQMLLHTGAFTHRRLYTQTPLVTDAFTHRRFYTQMLWHTDAFTHRRFYTQTLLHTDAFTHRCFYKQMLWACLQYKIYY